MNKSKQISAIFLLLIGLTFFILFLIENRKYSHLRDIEKHWIKCSATVQDRHYAYSKSSPSVWISVLYVFDGRHYESKLPKVGLTDLMRYERDRSLDVSKGAMLDIRLNQSKPDQVDWFGFYDLNVSYIKRVMFAVIAATLLLMGSAYWIKANKHRVKMPGRASVARYENEAEDH